MTDIANIRVRQIAPDRRPDGVILMTIGRNTRSINKTSEFEAVIAIDQKGDIVWHKEFEFGLMDCRLSLSETLLIMGSDGRMVELGLDGERIRQWYTAPRFPDGADGIPVDTVKLHHTIAEIAPDLFLSLSVEQLPLPEPFGDWTHFMADTVILFDREGRIRNEYSLGAALDPGRSSYGAEAPYWVRQGWPGTLDWSHSNSAIADPADGGFLVSVRHQDAVVKLDRDGNLVWILGAPSNWREPWRSKILNLNGGRPFYHQHDLSFTKDGQLMLFDNGVNGAAPPDPMEPLDAHRSYALAYSIDEAAGTATEVWRYGGEELPYSMYVSGVCEMDSGNRFIACAGVKTAPGGGRVDFPPDGIGSIVMKEVTPEDEVVFEAEISDPSAGPDSGWNGFRPEYVPAEIAKKLK